MTMHLQHKLLYNGKEINYYIHEHIALIFSRINNIPIAKSNDFLVHYSTQ